MRETIPVIRFVRLSIVLGVALVLAACTSEASSASDPDPSRETVVVEFLVEQNDRWRAGDVDWMVERLHSTTFQFWTPEECAEVLRANRDLPTNRLEQIGDLTYQETAAFDYGGGRVAEFRDLYIVNVVELDSQGPLDSTRTVAFEDGEPKWFGSCDSPELT